VSALGRAVRWVVLSLFCWCLSALPGSADAKGVPGGLDSTFIHTLMYLSGQPPFWTVRIPGTNDTFLWRAISGYWGEIDVLEGDSVHVTLKTTFGIAPDSAGTADSSLSFRVGDHTVPPPIDAVVERMRYGTVGEMWVTRRLLGNFAKGLAGTHELLSVMVTVRRPGEK
jgi:hypothetical protein